MGTVTLHHVSFEDIERSGPRTTGFLSDTGKTGQWSGFLGRMGLEKTSPRLSDVGFEIAEFAGNLGVAARRRPR